MRVLFLIIMCLLAGFKLQAQYVQQARDLQPDKAFENILVNPLTVDSLTSGFVIWIKDTVAAHKHLYHSEHIFVLEGNGRFYLNNEVHEIKEGDFFMIPKDHWHAVKVNSEKPMKVISIQSPGFDGSDRIFKDPPKQN